MLFNLIAKMTSLNK